MEYFDIEEDNQIYYCECKCNRCNAKFKVKGTYKELLPLIGISNYKLYTDCPVCNHYRSGEVISKIKKYKEKNEKKKGRN